MLPGFAHAVGGATWHTTVKNTVGDWLRFVLVCQMAPTVCWYSLGTVAAITLACRWVWQHFYCLSDVLCTWCNFLDVIAVSGKVLNNIDFIVCTTYYYVTNMATIYHGNHQYVTFSLLSCWRSLALMHTLISVSYTHLTLPTNREV